MKLSRLEQVVNPFNFHDLNKSCASLMIVDFTPVQKTVFPYVVSSSTNALEQKKVFT